MMDDNIYGKEKNLLRSDLIELVYQLHNNEKVNDEKLNMAIEEYNVIQQTMKISKQKGASYEKK